MYSEEEMNNMANRKPHCTNCKAWVYELVIINNTRVQLCYTCYNRLQQGMESEQKEEKQIQESYPKITKGEIRFLRYAFDQLVKGMEELD